jgi:hypothetical protein
MRILLNISKTAFFLIGLFFSINGIAQQTDNSCKDALNLADKEYKAGRINKCIELLNPCIDKLESKVKFEAYRLLALCYLDMNDEKNANNAALNLLRNKPNYREFPFFDPKGFTNLLSKYDVWPQLEFGIKTGINFNSVRLIKNFSVINSDAAFLPQTGYQAGITAEYYIKKNISLNADLLYEGLNYKRTSVNGSVWSQEFTEKLNYFSIPLAIRYYFYKTKTLRFGAELGLQTQILSKTNSDIVLSNSETQEKVENTIEQKNQRNKALFYGLGGLVIKYKLGGGTVSADFRYAFGLSNVVKTSKRYDNLNFILANQYIDSDFSFTPFYITLGYQFAIHKMYSVKLKR